MEAEVITATAQRNETLDTIYSRRAIRKYEDKAVSRKMIDEIIAAGRMAPSAKNEQRWRFYVLTNKQLIHAISKDISQLLINETTKKGIRQILKSLFDSLKYIHDMPLSAISDPVFYSAPVVIFITAPKDYEWAQLDIGMCAQNMLLAATSLGLAGCPIGAGKFVEHTQHYPQLHIPDNEHIYLVVIIGYSHYHPLPHERKTDNVYYVE